MSTPHDGRTLATACLGWAVALCISGGACRGDAIPAAMFGDHMVLQRDRPVPLWGTGRPGELVRVSFGDAAGETVVDGHGRWRLELPRLFELGHDGRFHPAVARIVGDAVIVEAAGVEAAGMEGPWSEVRYARVPFPGEAANLVNTSGLPATPFCLQRAP